MPSQQLDLQHCLAADRRFNGGIYPPDCLDGIHDDEKPTGSIPATYGNFDRVLELVDAESPGVVLGGGGWIKGNLCLDYDGRAPLEERYQSCSRIFSVAVLI
jgi:hypothetical protein